MVATMLVVVVVAAVVAVAVPAAAVAEPPPYTRDHARYGASPRSSQAIVFGDRGGDEFERANGMPGIPITMAEALSKTRNIDDLANLVGHSSYMKYDIQNMARNAQAGEVEDELRTRFGGRSEDSNKNGEMAKSAICQPEMTTVPVKEAKDPNTIYWPSCTRVKRCGGCCSHELLSCKPTASRTIHVQVVRVQYIGASSGVRYSNTEMVPLEIHTACECGCKLSAQDCNVHQEYIASDCRCKCTNKDAYYRCTKTNNKLWEPSTCRCKCRKELACSTGRYFDHSLCSCRPIPNRGQLASRFYTRYRTEDNYSSDDNFSSDDDVARHAEPSSSSPRLRAGSRRRQVLARGPQRSDRYDSRARRE